MSAKFYNLTFAMNCIFVLFFYVFSMWFWKESRTLFVWAIYLCADAATMYAWWHFLRKDEFSLSEATVIYDLLALLAWYPLLLFTGSDTTTLLQKAGLVFVTIGSLMVLF